MSERTIYKCDRCGTEQDSDDQLWSMCVLVSSSRWPVVTSSSYWNHRKDWCRKCVEELGMLPRVVLKDEPAPIVAPTLDDFLREIVREEIEAQNAG